MIRWYRNNEPVRPSRGYEVGHGNGECWLKLASVASEHVAEYKCEASNPAGKASSVSNLVLKPNSGKIAPVPAGAIGVAAAAGGAAKGIAKAPQLLQKLTAINARSGENVRFVAEFDGSPTPQIQWSFNGKPLVPKAEHKTTIEGKKAILQITRVTPSHVGVYALQLQNESGTAKSEARLNVQTEGSGGRCLRTPFANFPFGTQNFITATPAA